MVKKLKKWRKVKKRSEHVQIDVIGLDFYLITSWDEHFQVVCDWEHILMIGQSLIEMNIKNYGS